MAVRRILAYLITMSLLPLLPSLIAGLAVSASDLRSRRVPLAWVCAGIGAQIVTLMVCCARSADWSALVAAVGLGTLSALVQLSLALIRPGALGFGDVTATALIGVAIGSLGPVATAMWWLAMGSLGLALMMGTAIVHHGSDPHDGNPDADDCAGDGPVSIPFAPVIVAAGILTALIMAI